MFFKNLVLAAIPPLFRFRIDDDHTEQVALVRIRKTVGRGSELVLDNAVLLNVKPG